jgi:hypothetical protein
LVVGQNAGKKTYDCVKYEDQLYRFNQVERTLCYWHEIECAGIDHCYDCRAEVFVFEEYLRSFDRVKELTEKCGEKIESLSVVGYVELLNDHLNANMKKIRFVIEQKNYDIKFTDVRFGKTQSELFNDSSLVFTRRKTYFDNKFIPYAQIKRPLTHDDSINGDTERDNNVERNRNSKRTRFDDEQDGERSSKRGSYGDERRSYNRRSDRFQGRTFSGNSEDRDSRRSFDYSRLKFSGVTSDRDWPKKSHDKGRESEEKSCDLDKRRKSSGDELKIDTKKRK